MKTNRFIKKSWFYIRKTTLYPLVFINHRLYMRFYNHLLRRTGMIIKGQLRFISYSVQFDDFDQITLGDRLIVSSNVIFLTHDYSFTTSLISIDEKPTTDVALLGPITVGDNVFIGMNSILLPGTKIGNNVIVGAGSVVRGRIPDYSVVSGNPAVIINDIRKHAENIKQKNFIKRIDEK